MQPNNDLPHYKKITKEKFLSKRKESLERNKEHDRIINLTLGLFLGKDGILKQRTGFKLYLLEPFLDYKLYLEGKQPKNFDILIFNAQTKHAIFIEVKSSFRTLKKLFDDVDEQINVVENKKTELKEILRVNDVDDIKIEYVICLPSKQKRDVINKVLDDKKTNIILWTFSEITKIEPRLELHLFGKEEDELRIKRTHAHNGLRKTLIEGVTMKNVELIDFLMSSDICMKLEHYAPQIQQAKLNEFNFDRIKNNIFEGELEHEWSPQGSMEFVFRNLIEILLKLKKIEITKKTNNVLTSHYQLKFPQNWSPRMVKGKIRDEYFRYYSGKKSEDIEKEAKELHLQSVKNIHGGGLDKWDNSNNK